ncbi:kinesin-like protein KIN-12F isoform X2 [Prosopis cineraria]|uniref:kinesin-like protein KIN-12F isoform X2 n=1 Tax=Prosopis cineraria TaxID=364024 RepID=UPI00241006E6|nr:kinesin-like protein KIN-12F isoform X2 [Prosopis cineraria]
MRQSRISENAETGFFGSISSSSIRSLLPRSISSKQKSNSNPKIPKPNAENTPPSDPNIQVCDDRSSPATKQLQSKAPSSQLEVVESDAPRDSPVKVVVRIRPPNNEGSEGDETIKKVSSDTLCIADSEFTFDLVFDSNSYQEDIFQSVGVSLVKNALAGYNTSLLSYGQPGSGKTYTMWGPLSAMVEEPSRYSKQGMAPRIFRMLFSELEREQHKGQQFNYQCRCSFLEIYNEKIGNLLDPVQQNLELKEDSNNALYIENLTEEYVTSYEDVAQILIKGLSRRKVGEASSNSERSRSHIIFTFTVASWCKQTSKGFRSSTTSRITLIDLAGLNKNENEADRLCVRESKNLKKSLSDFGSNSETLRTLRFGQRIRSIRNKSVINEIKDDEANGLSDQIRQLKEELVREKANVHNSMGSKNGCFQGRNVRESLNKLRVSLNRSLLLHQIDNDTEEKANVDEADIKQLSKQINDLYGPCEIENSIDISVDEDGSQVNSVEESFDADMIEGDETEKKEEDSEKTLNKLCHEDKMTPSDDHLCTLRAIKSSSRNSISVSSPILEPPLSESPKIRNTQRKSMAVSSSYLGGWNNAAGSLNYSKDMLRQSGKVLPGPTESLAASLQRGLQIIDYHQQNSALNKSSTSFSFEHLTLEPCSKIDKVDSSMQTTQEKLSSDVVPANFLCGSCGIKVSDMASAEHLENEMAKAIKREKELEIICQEQRSRIEQLSQLVEKYRGEKEINSLIVYDQEIDRQIKDEEYNSLEDKDKLLSFSTSENLLRHISEGKSEIKEVEKEFAVRDTCFDDSEKEALLKEIQILRNKLQLCGGDAPVKKSTDKLRSSLISRSIQLQKSGVSFQANGGEELEKERQRWTEMESEWICLTDELRVDLESSRQHLERVELELKLEKKCKEELDDALKRAVDGHSRMIEHYAELQERYDEVAAKHNAIMEGIAEMKAAAAKAGKKGHAKFAKSLAAELSTMRVEREREREFLKKENRSLKIQLRDTAEAVHAAGELLVRLREAEHAVSITQENFANVQEENGKLKKKIEKLQRKQKMEMITMKQYLADSKLPEAALKPLYREDSYDAVARNNADNDDDQAWRAEFGAIYQEHY